MQNFLFKADTGDLIFEVRDRIRPFLGYELFIQSHWWQTYGTPLTAITMKGEEVYLLKAMRRGEPDLFLRTTLSPFGKERMFFADFHFKERVLTSIKFQSANRDEFSEAQFRLECKRVIRLLNANLKKHHRFKWNQPNTYRYEHDDYTLIFRLDETIKHWEVVLSYRER